ncbi:MAG: RDD family protein [Cryobacterium sp.]|nr:RDD family protein [Cryobacterium sp.]
MASRELSTAANFAAPAKGAAGGPIDFSTNVASADDDELITGEAVALSVRPTGFVLRGAGAVIDWVVYFGLWIGIFFALSILLAGGILSDATFSAFIVVALVFCIVVIPTTVELLSRGRSLGKLAIGARIVRDDGGAIGFRHAFIRALTGVLEIFGTLGGMAALVALFNSKAKRLGDRIAGTYSQNERITRYEAPVFGVPLELVEWSRTADVAKMPDQLGRRISQFLSSASGYTPQSRVWAARSLAAEAAPYVSPLPAADPELFLAAISVVRRDREFAALQAEKARLATLAPALEKLPRDFPTRA